MPVDDVDPQRVQGGLQGAGRGVHDDLAGSSGALVRRARGAAGAGGLPSLSVRSSSCAHSARTTRSTFSYRSRRRPPRRCRRSSSGVGKQGRAR